MKKLDNSFISDTAQMPIKKGTLEFLQQAHQETAISIVKAMVGSAYANNTPYVLFGLVESGTGLVHNISAGAIVVLDEIFLVDAVAFTSPSGEVPVMSFNQTQYATDADPVTFTDLSIHSVHNISKFAITSGASGSGGFDFSTLTRLTFDISTETAARILADIALQNQINTINAVKHKVINIGAWDMDIATTVNVAHGIADFKDISGVEVVIYDDALSVSNPIEKFDPSTGYNIGGGVTSINSTNIQVSRIVGGSFDSALYNDGTMNRGLIHITYI